MFSMPIRSADRTGAIRSSSPSPVSRLLALIAHEIRVRRDLRTLSSLGDSALHDIGLARGGLEEAVRHGRPGWGSRDARFVGSDRFGCAPQASAFTEWR